MATNRQTITGHFYFIHDTFKTYIFVKIKPIAQTNLRGNANSFLFMYRAVLVKRKRIVLFFFRKKNNEPSLQTAPIFENHSMNYLSDDGVCSNPARGLVFAVKFLPPCCLRKFTVCYGLHEIRVNRLEGWLNWGELT